MSDHRSSDAELSRQTEAATDRDLLARFVRDADERAFEEIVRRYDTLVLGVCRRVLYDRHAAEDAFQATFLVLARSARSIRRRRSLASWLYSVAYRIARRALADRHRRREQARPMEPIASPPVLRDVAERHEQQLLDEELQELPEKYREPLVLHHLQGLTQQQVAERLGVSVAAVDGRLKRGRKELKLRLMRRGVELSAVFAVVHTWRAAAEAASIEPLIALTTQAAVSGSAIPSTISSQAVALAGKELSLMTASTKLVMTLGLSAVVVTLLGLAAVSAATGPGSGASGPPPELATAVADGSPAETQTTSWLAQGDAPDTESQADAAPTATTGEETPEDLMGALQALAMDLQDYQILFSTRIQALQDRLNANATDNQASADELQRSLAELGARVDSLAADIARLGAQSGGTDTTGDTTVGAPPDETRLPVRPPTLDYSESSPARERIEAALDEPTQFEFVATAFADVVEYLGQLHNIPMMLDEDALLHAGIGPDEEVTLVLSDVRLRNALDLLLENVAGVPLDYVIQNEVMRITTREKAEQRLETRVYNLRHLAPTYAPAEVAQMIRSTIRPWTWRSADGFSIEEPGVSMGPDVEVDPRFQASVEALPDALVVTQSQRIHREIVDLLDQLHRHSPQSTTSAVIEAAVHEQLDQLTDLAFDDMPWFTVVRFLANEHDLNIVIDEAALAAADVDRNQNITITVLDITVRSALNIVLSKVGLAYVIADEVIKITTPQRAEQMTTRADEIEPAATAHSVTADGEPADQADEPSLLSHLEPGQRVMHTRYENGLVRLEVVGPDLLAAAEGREEVLAEWPMVESVTDDYVELRWDTEERTATQILSRDTILEVWLDNELQPTAPLGDEGGS